MLAWSRGRGMESLSTAEARCFIIDSMHVLITVCHTWIAEDLYEGSSLS